jgi:hypothetical protein
MEVKKYGRTTGQTNGRVDAINATVNVGYDSGTALYTGQVIIKASGGGSFSAGGDSGSLSNSYRFSSAAIGQSEQHHIARLAFDQGADR